MTAGTKDHARRAARGKPTDASPSVRALLVLGLALLLGAPTPGAVGSCGGDELSGEADVVAYCQEREQLVCERRRRRGKLDDDGAQICRHEVIELCARRFWPNECRPTERVARACLNALRSLDTLQIEEDEIEECKAESLCTIEGQGPVSIGDEGNAGKGGK
jgi:hypothetical protein